MKKTFKIHIWPEFVVSLPYWLPMRSLAPVLSPWPTKQHIIGSEILKEYEISHHVLMTPANNGFLLLMIEERK